MTIQDCIDTTFKLLNQYTIMGTPVPSTYNDQEDDEIRMIPFINDAIMEIATVARPILAFTEFEVPPKSPNEPVRDIDFAMPSDFDRATAVLFTPAFGRDRTAREASDYKWLGNDVILVPNAFPGTYRVEYMRYPAQYTADTPRDTILDNTPDTHSVIPYYVAAMIANYDDQKAYYNLFNMWETRLSRLGYKPPHATSERIDDVYGFNRFGHWSY